MISGGNIKQCVDSWKSLSGGQQLYGLPYTVFVFYFLFIYFCDKLVFYWY